MSKEITLTFVVENADDMSAFDLAVSLRESLSDEWWTPDDGDTTYFSAIAFETE